MYNKIKVFLSCVGIAVAGCVAAPHATAQQSGTAQQSEFGAFFTTPTPSALSSPWPRSHRTPGQQASTPLPGPDAGNVQTRFFPDDAGKAFGTSPFMVLSGAKYPGRPGARTVWGATLTDVYKYEIDGDTFRFADSFEINKLPIWVGWNLFRQSGDRIVVPNPSGLRLAKYRGSPCYGTAPSLLVFRDGADPSSPIACVSKFEFTKRKLQASCGFRRTAIGTTAVLTGELPGGEVAVSLVEERGRGRHKSRVSHLAVLDPGLSRILACSEVGPGTLSNQFPVEALPNGRSVAYVATERAIVAMRYDPARRRLERGDVAAVAFRGRTGTTPTLMDTADGRRLLLVVDARCAVTKVFTGAIACSGDRSPSRIVVLDRDALSAPPIVAPLPEFMETVENSPSVSGGSVVVANYSGYTPDGPKDGRRDFAKGIVKLSWTGNSLAIDWARDDIQISGIPTISTASRMIYGSGASEDGTAYFNGLDFATGNSRMRVAVGSSVPSRRGGRDGLYDAGNQTLINDDGSAIFPAGEWLVRVR